MSPTHWDCCLDAAEWLVCPIDSKSYAGIYTPGRDSKSQRLKKRHQEMYWAANKGVKRRARADKRKYMEDFASLAEETATRKEQGPVYIIHCSLFVTCGCF